MTIPSDIIYPFRPEEITSAKPEELSKYVRDLVFTMSRTYQDTAEAVNGNIRDFTPTVVGLTTAGTGTYSYQSGIYLRQGLLVDYWFDVSWTAHTGAGNLGVGLPYQCRSQANTVWHNSCMTYNITFPAGRTYASLVCLNDTFTAALVVGGSAVTDANVTIPASGRIRAHLRYLGVGFET